MSEQKTIQLVLVKMVSITGRIVWKLGNIALNMDEAPVNIFIIGIFN